MSKSKLIYLPLGALTIVTATSGAVLSGFGVSAADATCTTVGSGSSAYRQCAQTVNAKVTVGSACTMTSNPTEATGHSLTLTPGTTTVEGDNAPVTTLTMNCNNGGSYDVYAMGYYNNAASTALSGTSGTINTSASIVNGTSSWAFKLAGGGSDGTVSITSGYTNYSAIPGSQTKVASLGSSAGATAGSTVTATYRVYLAASQAAGTYSGGVKYTMVSPTGTALQN